MKTIIKLGLAAMAAAIAATGIAATAYAQQGPKLIKRETVKMNPFVVLGCEINGSPAEFPNDLVFTNTSQKVLPAGKKIQWRTHGPVYQNSYTLKADLKPGAGVRAFDVLPGGIEAGKPCSASALL